MSDKEYKLQQWSSRSLYYSFPDGNLHHSIGKVIARVENDLNGLYNENEQIKASLYAEKTNTAEVINEYAKQFKRHSSQFSFMIDLAEDLGIDVSKLEALDD